MKRYVSIIILICSALFVCSCGDRSNSDKNYSDTKDDVNSVDLFVPDAYGIKKAENKYQLKQPDSVNACIEEIMDALVEEYTGAIVKYNYMMKDEKTLELIITLDRVYDKRDSMLITAAITNTLFNLDGIDKIGMDLIAIDDTEMESLLVDRNTFYLYGYSKDFGYNYNDTVFYLPNDNGDGLTKSNVKLYSVANDSFYKRIVEYLVEVKVIPSKTIINYVNINDRICYVDFSKEFEDASSVKSSLIVYSIVNTLTSLDNIDKVVITENGTIVDTYKKTVDISKPLEFNQDLVK